MRVKIDPKTLNQSQLESFQYRAEDGTVDLGALVAVCGMKLPLLVTGINFIGLDMDDTSDLQTEIILGTNKDQPPKSQENKDHQPPA